jgi:ribosomal protein S8
MIKTHSLKLQPLNNLGKSLHTLETSLTGKALDFGSSEYGFDPRVSNIRYNSYAYVINHLNLAIARKKLRIRFKYTRRTLDLTKALFTIGYISHYSIVSEKSPLSDHKLFDSKNSWIYVNTIFFKNTPFFKSLRLVSTPSKKHTTTLKGLRVINLSIKSSVIVLSTPYGIIDHREALRIGTGGTILCIAS